MTGDLFICRSYHTGLFKLEKQSCDRYLFVNVVNLVFIGKLDFIWEPYFKGRNAHLTANHSVTVKP